MTVHIKRGGPTGFDRVIQSGLSVFCGLAQKKGSSPARSKIG